jgi:hypothetical protein
MRNQKTASGAGRAEGRKAFSLEAERAFRNKNTSPRPARQGRATISVQCGVPLDTIRHALLRDAHGVASSPLGVALDLLAVSHERG